MIIKIQPDIQKSKSLLKSANITQERLNETDKYKYPSNTLTDYYDIIHKLLEALTLSEGIKIKGDGANIELINYICNKYKLKESERVFLQELREYRNRISYEGFHVNKDYISTNLERIDYLIKKLYNLITE